MERKERIVLESKDYDQAVKMIDRSCLCKIIRVQPKVNLNVLKLKNKLSGWVVK